MNAADGPAPKSPDAATLARDHLANERTYLAWLRTSVAVMALGLAIAGFASTTTATSVAAGAILVLTGTAGVYYGTTRYRHVTAELESGVYRAGERGRAAVYASTILVIAVFAALVTLLIGRN